MKQETTIIFGRLARRAGALGLAAALLGGCASPTVPESPDDSSDTPSQRRAEDVLAGLDLSGASTVQAAEIGDRSASAEEYETAFRRYEECLSAAGFDLGSVRSAGNMYEFAVPDAVVEGGADAECYESEFRFVDMLWQATDEVQSSRGDEQMARECLLENGIEPAGSLEEMTAQLREAGIEAPDCL
ncbi:hypothetical protein [Paraoerskovia marina]|uniref:hypothetical protein n=1 Tax=Paraoerskovia marina TaxID=545619 RepID=UPI0005B831FF|nr:hypothetical protein [Paraoerskovia marina]